MEKWAVIPVIPGTDHIAGKIGNEYGKIVLLYVVDSSLNLPTATMGTEIKKAEDRIENIKAQLAQKNITTKDYIEWGTWEDKLKAIMHLEQCDEILITKELLTTHLVKRLKKNKMNVVTI